MFAKPKAVKLADGTPISSLLTAASTIKNAVVKVTNAKPTPASKGLNSATKKAA